MAKCSLHLILVPRGCRQAFRSPSFTKLWLLVEPANSCMRVKMWVACTYLGTLGPLGRNLLRRSIVKYTNISLNTLGVLIALHLKDSHSSVPSATYAPTRNGEPKVEEKLVLAVKRKWQTDLLTTVAWEHFEEMMPDTRPFSLERRGLIGQLLTSWGCDS